MASMCIRSPVASIWMLDVGEPHGARGEGTGTLVLGTTATVAGSRGNAARRGALASKALECVDVSAPTRAPHGPTRSAREAAIGPRRAPPGRTRAAGTASRWCRMASAPWRTLRPVQHIEDGHRAWPVPRGTAVASSNGPASIASTTATLACERAWEVDFEIRRDRHAAQSVAFLRSQGFDFNAAREWRRLGGVRGEAHRCRGRRADAIGERRCAGPGTSS